MNLRRVLRFQSLADLVRATSGHYPPVVPHFCFSHIQVAEIPASFVIHVFLDRTDRRIEPSTAVYYSLDSVPYNVVA